MGGGVGYFYGFYFNFLDIERSRGDSFIESGPEFFPELFLFIANAYELFLSPTWYALVPVIVDLF